jgi:hypothetical protein
MDEESTTHPGSGTDDAGVGSETALGEGLPDGAGVLTAGESLVGSEDGVARVLEGRAARLKLHTVDDELRGKKRDQRRKRRNARGRIATNLNSEGVAVLRDLLAGLGEVVLGVVAVGVGAVDGRREEGGVEAVVVDEVLSEGEKELRPDLTDGMDAPITGLVEELDIRAKERRRGRGRKKRRRVSLVVLEGAEEESKAHLVGRRVRLETARVGVVADTALAAAGPRSHVVVRDVDVVEANHRREEVTPTLTHSSSFTPSEAARIGGTTGETGRETVRVPARKKESARERDEDEGLAHSWMTMPASKSPSR